MTTKTGLRSIASLLAAAGVLSATAPAAAASCRADSGTARATLVELYTSEGCSSCPPADRTLHGLAARGPGVVPVALHVDYWDSLGWTDRFAQPSFAERQRWEVRANGERTSFTPHFFVNGRVVDDWQADLDAALKPVAMPAAARLSIVADPTGAALHVRVDGDVAAAGRRGPSRLFVVVTQDRLTSQVSAGENRGARLEHDAVARVWIGPVDVDGGRVAFDRVLQVPQVADGAVRVVAFVQDGTTAEVLQAVATGVCRAG